MFIPLINPCAQSKYSASIEVVLRYWFAKFPHVSTPNPIIEKCFCSSGYEDELASMNRHTATTYRNFDISVSPISLRQCITSAGDKKSPAGKSAGFNNSTITL